MNIKHLSLFSFCFSAFFTLSSHAQSFSVVNDDFSVTTPDEDNTNTDAAYYSTSTSSAIEFNTNSVGLVSGGSGRALHAIFPSQELTAEGDTITVSTTFVTPATVDDVDGANGGEELRIGFFDTLGLTSSEQDANGTELGLGQDISYSTDDPAIVLSALPGYFTEIDVDPAGITNQDIEIRRHDVITVIDFQPNPPGDDSSNSFGSDFDLANVPGTGRLLGTTGSFDSLGSSSDNGYLIAANTTYTVTVNILRNSNDGLEVTSTLFEGGTQVDTHTEIDDTPASFSFGMWAIATGSDAFGSSNAVGAADNGIDITSLTVDANIAGGGTPPADDAEEDTCFPIVGTDGTSVVCL